MKKPKIVFMGTPEFSVPSLEAIHDKYGVSLVITVPDKQQGRGLKLSPSPVKVKALELGIPVLQPAVLKEESFINELKELAPDIIVVIAFRILPKEIFTIPCVATFNIHGSLLPKYRGAAPINWAIINGEKETGVTTFFLQHKIDTGDIIDQQKVIIEPNETAGELHDKLMIIGSKLVLKTVQAIENNTIKTIPQNSNQELKEAFKIFKPDCKIDWNLPIDIIHNKVRGLSPYPTAWTTLMNKENKELLSLKIFKTLPVFENHQLEPKTIIATKNTIKIAVHGGYIEIVELQLEGKKRMDVPALLNGFNINQYQLID